MFTLESLPFEAALGAEILPFFLLTFGIEFLVEPVFALVLVHVIHLVFLAQVTMGFDADEVLPAKAAFRGQLAQLFHNLAEAHDIAVTLEGEMLVSGCVRRAHINGAPALREEVVQRALKSLCKPTRLRMSE